MPRWSMVLLVLACGGSIPEPRNASVEWASTPLDAWLPHEDCPFGGTSRRACRRGCTIIATSTGTRDEVQIQRWTHDRSFHLTLRADGTLTARASISREHRRLDATLFLVREQDESLEGMEDTIDTPGSTTPDRAAEVWTEVFGWLRQSHLPHGIDRRAGRARIYVWREANSETRRTDRLVGGRGERAHGAVGVSFERSPRAEQTDAEPSASIADAPATVVTRDDQGRVINLVEDGDEVAHVTRDASGRVIGVRGEAYELTVERDDQGRVVVENVRRGRHSPRRLEHTYDGERLVLSRWTDGDEHEHVGFAYDGACDGVTPSLPPDHDPEADSSVAWW